MARYMEIASDLRKEVDKFLESFGITQDTQAANDAGCMIGHIINLAVRCAPRPVQSTVRLNIVKEAVGHYCKVTMTEELDERTGNTYHKIHITPRS